MTKGLHTVVVCGLVTDTRRGQLESRLCSLVTNRGEKDPLKGGKGKTFFTKVVGYSLYTKNRPIESETAPLDS